MYYSLEDEQKFKIIEEVDKENTSLVVDYKFIVQTDEGPKELSAMDLGLINIQPGVTVETKDISVVNMKFYATYERRYVDFPSKSESESKKSD